MTDPMHPSDAEILDTLDPLAVAQARESVEADPQDGSPRPSREQVLVMRERHRAQRMEWLKITPDGPLCHESRIQLNCMARDWMTAVRIFRRATPDLEPTHHPWSNHMKNTPENRNPNSTENQPPGACPDCNGVGEPLPDGADHEEYSRCGNCKGWTYEGGAS